MIVLGNQLTLQFSLGSVSNYSQFTDFIEIEDLKLMAIQENSGGPRPVLTLTFKIKKENIIPYLNNGKIIT